MRGLPLCALFFFASLTNAQELRIDEAEAVKRALERDDVLELEQSALEERKAKRAQAVSVANPQLRLRHRRFDRLVAPAFGDEEPAPLDGAQVNVRFRVPGIDRILGRGTSTGALVEASEANLMRARENLRTDTQKLFRTYINVRERLALTEKAVAVTQSLVDLAQKRVESRVGTSLDLGLAKLEHLDALSDRKSLSSRTKRAERALMTLVGVSAQNVEWVRGESHCKAAPANLESIKEKALASSPLLEELRAEVRAVKGRLFETKLGNVPWFDFVEAGWAFGDENSPGSVGLRLGMTLPLWNFGGAQSASQRAALRRKEARLRVAERDLALRVVQAAQDLSQAHELVVLYQSAVSDTVTPIEKDAKRALELGQSEAVELAIVNGRLLAAERARLRAELACERAAVDFEALVSMSQGSDARE